MSNIGNSEPYPSDQYLVDQIHHKVEKDFYAAALASHDWFGFGQNHQTGGDYIQHYYVEMTDGGTITTSKTFVTGGEDVVLPVPEKDGQAIAVISRNEVISFRLVAPTGYTLEGSESEIVYSREIFSLISVGTDWRLAD
jgi:hypothetical protein